METTITTDSQRNTPHVVLDGLRFDALTETQVIDTVRSQLGRGNGGWIVTPNVDIIRQSRRDHAARSYVASGSLVLADGAPLVWASKLARQPLPARVAGSDLIWSLCALAAAQRRRVFLIGGSPDAWPATASIAAQRLIRAFPGLHVAGACSPPVGFDMDGAAMKSLNEELAAAAPDLVFVGLGFPKQERLISQLMAQLPASWFLGCGASIDFVSGNRRRAPMWMQRTGLEWLHRLAAQPRRMFSRYLVHGIPAACGLLGRSILRGIRKQNL